MKNIFQYAIILAKYQIVQGDWGHKAYVARPNFLRLQEQPWFVNLERASLDTCLIELVFDVTDLRYQVISVLTIFNTQMYASASSI